MYEKNSIFVEDLENNLIVAQKLVQDFTEIFVRIEA